MVWSRVNFFGYLCINRPSFLVGNQQKEGVLENLFNEDAFQLTIDHIFHYQPLMVYFQNLTKLSFKPKSMTRCFKMHKLITSTLKRRISLNRYPHFFSQTFIYLSMQKKTTAIILVCLIVLAYGQGVVDFTYANDCSGTYVKEKKVDVTYSYNLATNKWTTFPGMFIEFYLDQAQWVYIKYHIRTYTGCACHFSTGVHIDGIWDKMFQVEHDYAWHYTNIASNDVFLEKGRHTVEVRYHTDSPRQVNGDWNWPAVLVVRYQSKTP